MQIGKISTVFKVYDAMMGSGKTTQIIENIRTAGGRYHPPAQDNLPGDRRTHLRDTSTDTSDHNAGERGNLEDAVN